MTAVMNKTRTAGLAFVFLWFFIGGIAHFAAPRLEESIVPPYIPWPHAAVIVSGVCELFGAVGLLHLRTRRAAAASRLAGVDCVEHGTVCGARIESGGRHPCENLTAVMSRSPPWSTMGSVDEMRAAD